VRTKTSNLITAEKSTSATPYISITLTGSSTYTYTTTDSPNRVKSIKHSEQPYEDWAVIILGNQDKTLPASLAGYKVDISYGYRVAGVNYQTDPLYCAPLWVKQQFQISKQGDVDIVLQCYGAWTTLAETNYIASLLAAAAAPYYDIDYTSAAYTVYDIIEAVLAGLNFDLATLGVHDDSIVDTLMPMFMVNYQGNIEAARDVIYRLLNMTKCFMRAENTAGLTVESSDIATGDNSFPHRRKSFYVLGLYWVIYTVATQAWFKTSADGVTWSEATLITGVGSSSTSADFFVESRGGVVYLHYVSASAGVAYRRGILSGSGGLSWPVAQQTVEANSGLGMQRPCITVDSNGYAVVGYGHNTGVIPLEWHGHVNANNDGTWATGNNSVLSDSSHNWGGCCAPTTDGKVIMLYGTSDEGEHVYGRVWSGTAWSAQDASDTTTKGLDIGGSWPVGIVCVTTIGHIVFFNSSGNMQYLTMDSATALFSSETTIQASAGAGTPILSKDSLNNLYCIWYKTDSHVYYSKRDVGTGIWGSSVDCGVFDISLNGLSTWNGFITLPNDLLLFVYKTTGGVLKMVNSIPAYRIAVFRIIYPNAWTSYHNTFTSDRPDATYHQFKEFEWQDHLLIPTHVIVVANRVDKADGTWEPEPIMKIGDYAPAGLPEGGYHEILQYHLAETLTTEALADTRAEVIAKRQWMEEALGRVLVQHDCGLELYDYIQVRDKRGAANYTDYPPTKWNTTYGKMCVVGSLVHTYAPGVYNLEITLNGISSSTSVYEVAKPKTAQEIVNWGFIGGVGGGGLLPEQQNAVTQAQPFKPVLNPARYGGKPAVWNAMLDLATGGNQIRRDITNQAIVWAGKVAPQYQKPAGFDEWLASLGPGGAGTATPKPPTTPTPVTDPSKLFGKATGSPSTDKTNWSARRPGESLFAWRVRTGR